MEKIKEKPDVKVYEELRCSTCKEKLGETEYITSPSGKHYCIPCSLSAMDRAISKRPISDGQ